MKVSRAWLQKYFAAPLPEGQALEAAFTFRSFEVEERKGDLLDLKVLPDRSGYALCHRGVASELAAALDVPMKIDPLRALLPELPKTSELSVTVGDARKCSRYMAALVQGATIGPSPIWLKEALESVGQRSINNVVDATNFVMLDIGQPLHAFDAEKLVKKNGAYAFEVRGAKQGEKIQTLSGDEYEMPDGALLIVDAHADTPIGIAGVKGGRAAEITSATTNLVIEAANFDGASVRRAAQHLRLFTDASVRFQNRPSPELAAYGMHGVLALITALAGGKVVGIVDAYPTPLVPPIVSVSLEKINGVLGSNFSREEVSNVFRRLRLPVQVRVDPNTITFSVSPPFERTDLVIPEDLIEEVGRVLGYDRVLATELPFTSKAPDQARFRGIERMKDQLVEQGFTEVSTQSFVQKGTFCVVNPLDKAKPALRDSLETNLFDALEQAKRYAPLVLPPKERPKLFEVGAVFPKGGEHVELRMTERVPTWGEDFPTVDNLSEAKLEDYGNGYKPKRYALGVYRTFSPYPFVVRDISLWIDDSDSARGKVFALFGEKGEGLLAQAQLLDQFSNKEGRQSLAFRLVFQSYERTLTDAEVNGIMERIAAALTGFGYEVR